MKTKLLLVALFSCSALLGGCSAEAQKTACSVLSPSPSMTPTGQNSSQTAGQGQISGTGNGASGGAPQQDCP